MKSRLITSQKDALYPQTGNQAPEIKQGEGVLGRSLSRVSSNYSSIVNKVSQYVPTITLNRVAGSIVAASYIAGAVYAVGEDDDVTGRAALAVGTSMAVSATTAAIQYMRGQTRDAKLWAFGATAAGIPLGMLGSLQSKPEEDIIAMRERMLTYLREHPPLCMHAPLQIRNNYHCKPGYHSLVSPVTGSRAHELELVYDNPSRAVTSLMKNVAYEIYNTDTRQIIKKEFAQQAIRISSEMYSRYLDKYRADGVNEENAVLWTFNHDNGKGNLKVHDPLNRKKWTQSVHVTRTSSLSTDDQYMVPEGVVAIHELMHAEEKKPFLLRFELFLSQIVELLTTTNDMLLLDEIHKKIHDIDMSVEVDYNRIINVCGKPISLGKYANFYRELMATKNTLAEAYVSNESIEFLTKDCNVEHNGEIQSYWAVQKDIHDQECLLPESSKSIF